MWDITTSMEIMNIQMPLLELLWLKFESWDYY